MKIKDLKKIIEKLNDDMVIVTPSYDHSFRKIEEVFTTNIRYDSKNGIISEESGDEKVDQELGKRIEVLVVN